MRSNFWPSSYDHVCRHCGRDFACSNPREQYCFEPECREARHEAHKANMRRLWHLNKDAYRREFCKTISRATIGVN